jgi:hypothetical protein
MCNLYSVTKGQSAIRDLFAVKHDREPDGLVTMKKSMAVLALAVLATCENAYAQQAQPGRYQIVTAPVSQSQSSAEIFLLNTETGQSWTLLRAAGQSEEWVPVRFSNGKGSALVPLPPSPETVGVVK